MGHIAARAGLARNTLYNYARDKSALVLALTERAGRPAIERVAAIAARSADPAAERMQQIVEAVLAAFTDQAMHLMFRPGSDRPVAELPKGPDNPFHAIVVEVENVVRDGTAHGEFPDVGDVHPEMAARGIATANHLAAQMTPEQDERYGRLIQAMNTPMAAGTASGLTADAAARVIAKAVTTRIPRTGHTIGRDAAGLTLLTRMLSDRTLDRIIAVNLRRHYPTAATA